MAALPIAWALFAIGSKQAAAGYPHHLDVALCGRVLGAGVLAFVVYTALVLHGVVPMHRPFTAAPAAGVEGSSSSGKTGGLPPFAKLEEL